jgi:hypothetical protein
MVNGRAIEGADTNESVEPISCYSPFTIHHSPEPQVKK